MLNLIKESKDELTPHEKAFMKLCQLCGANFSQEEILATEIDWPAIWELALRHRVVPVMADRMKTLGIIAPDGINQSIEQNVQQNLYTGMKQAAELVWLTKLFEQHDVKFLAFKGIAFLKLMGLELHQRHHGDIDILLLDNTDLWKVDQHVRTLGYRRSHPEETIALNKKQKNMFLLLKKDLVYWHPEKEIRLEVHFKLFINEYTLPISTPEYYKNRSEIDINAHKIPVMNKNDYLSYLLIHGSISHWFRLKWLCDIAHISNTPNIYHSSIFLSDVKKLGIERMVSQGLKLSNYLFKTTFSNDLHTFPNQSSRVNRLLKDASVSLMEKEPYQTRNKNIVKKFEFNLKRISYDLSLKADYRYKINHLRKNSTNDLDWDVLPLPGSLFFLYYPLRPFLWLKRNL